LTVGSKYNHLLPGVDSANNYKDSTVDFANDWTVKAVTTLTTTAAGLCGKFRARCFLKLNFTGSSSLVY
jgi:hypothetical protein